MRAARRNEPRGLKRESLFASHPAHQCFNVRTAAGTLFPDRQTNAVAGDTTSCKLALMVSRRACGFRLLLLLLLVAQLRVFAQVPEKPSGSSSSRDSHPQSNSGKGDSAADSPDLGAVRVGVYRNTTFQISYKIPYGWVQRTGEMRSTPTQEEHSYVLLAAFERPPQAAGDSVNSAVVITAESLAEYPGLERAVDYFDIVDAIATDKGLKVLNPPYEFPVGTKKLARGDYSKQITDETTMYQGSLVLLSHGYAVLFTFIAGSEDELESLIMDLKLGANPKRNPSAKPN
jgi:hypothetical protein